MNDSVLKENENKRLTIRLPLLICFAMFSVWQMGMMIFSGESLSVGGRTPIPFEVSSQTVTILIAAGYILSIVFLLFFQRYCVKTARITVGAAFLSALALYLPLAPAPLIALFYIQAFCCTFMIGVIIATIVNLFTEQTEIKDIIVTLIFAGCLIAALQNDIAPVSFGVFQILTVIALTMLLLFYSKLPTKVWPRYVKKADNIVKPKSFMAGLFALIGFSSLIALLGSAVAGSTTHGVSIYYMSYAVCGVILAILWKWFSVIPLRSASVMVSVGAFGFVAAIVSLYIPAFSLPACAMLGAGGAAACMSSYFGIVMAKRYPSRFITPIIIGIAFIMVLFQTALLEALRDNLTALYITYLVIAVGLVILYLILEPYLIYSFRGKPLISDERAAELNEAARAAGGDPPVVEEPIADKPMPSAVGGLLKAKELSIEDLTDRERQIAQELMSGYNYNEISKRLHISVHTVNTHRKNIYEKFDVHNVPELIALMERLVKTQDEGGGL